MPDAHTANPQHGRIIFVCTYNRIRSPMAAALLADMHPDIAEIDSCGVAISDSLHSLADGFTIAVMQELGIDVSQHEAKDVTDMALTEADMIVCFSETSYEALCRMRKTLPENCDVLYWPVYDPNLLAENREQKLSGYRAVRDAIRARLQQHFAAVAKTP